jgi:two-component system response regulator FixJ
MPQTTAPSGNTVELAMNQPETNEPTVYLIDDDVDACNLLGKLLASESYRVETFYSAEEFLSRYAHDPLAHRCLVTDLRMPIMDGMALQSRLLAQNIRIPIIFLTGHGDVDYAVEAMKRGAIDFLQKPVDTEKLRQVIRQALEGSSKASEQALRRQELDSRISLLTAREREVLELLAEGNSTKQIAAQLSINPKTVFVHRARVLEKMGVDSLVALSQMMIHGRNGASPSSS